MEIRLILNASFSLGSLGATDPSFSNPLDRSAA